MQCGYRWRCRWLWKMNESSCRFRVRFPRHLIKPAAISLSTDFSAAVRWLLSARISEKLRVRAIIKRFAVAAGQGGEKSLFELHLARTWLHNKALRLAEQLENRKSENREKSERFFPIFNTNFWLDFPIALHHSHFLASFISLPN